MAIAGSGGWVPSCRVVLKQIGPVATGVLTNKPAELVYSDREKRAYGTLADGLARMRRGEPVQIDMTNGQFLRLLELWKEGADAASGGGCDERVSAGAVAPGAAADAGDGAAMADGGGFAELVD